MNPQVAARIHGVQELSKDVLEIVMRALWWSTRMKSA
jgi:hypothetical protein